MNITSAIECLLQANSSRPTGDNDDKKPITLRDIPGNTLIHLDTICRYCGGGDGGCEACCNTGFKLTHNGDKLKAFILRYVLPTQGKKQSYTYQDYCDIYSRCDGVTTHFVPVYGVQERRKKLLTQKDFYMKVARLVEINETDSDLPDYCESQAWAAFDIRSDLFLCEKLNPFYDVLSGKEVE